MLERRPLWGLIVLLNVSVVIWRMQEPAMLNVDYVDTANTDGRTNAQQQRATGVRSPTHYIPKLQQRARERLNKELTQRQQLAERNSIAQQLYAGKHLLAESAEANEIATKVTRYADDSLHTSSSYYSGSSRSNSSGSSSGTSRSKYKSKKLLKSNKIKSTPASPLVTAATLRNSADLRTITTTTTSRTTTAHEMRTYLNFPPHDPEQLIDLHDFTYLISQRGCSRDIQALILVHSAPANGEKRRLIRDTWGNTDILPHINSVMPLRLIFLLGTVETEAQQLDIERENFENGDIIQGSFVDSYRNMTYKHVMALKWFLYNCAHAQILIKVDDDVYVNTPQLLIYLQRAMWSEELRNSAGAATAIEKQTADVSKNQNSHESTILENSSRLNSSANTDNIPNMNATSARPFIATHMLFRHPHNLLFCKTNVNAQVRRSFRSKWRVTMREHAGKYYPPYCPGFAIIYSSDVVLRLYKAAQLSKYFWIDDVHITGILAQNLNISITNAQRDILYEDECDNLLSGLVNSEDTEFLYAWHLIQPEQMQKLWQLYLDKAQRHLSTLSTSMHSAKKTSSYDPTEFNKFKNYR